MPLHLPFALTFTAIAVSAGGWLYPRVNPFLGFPRDVDEGPRSWRALQAAARLAFSVSVGLSATLALLILLEVTAAAPLDRLGLINLALGALVGCLSAVLPFLLCATAALQWARLPRRQAAAAAAAYGAWWVALLYAHGLLESAAEFALLRGNSHLLVLDISLVGVLLTGVLAGVGCVLTPWAAWARRRRQCSPERLERMEAALRDMAAMVALPTRAASPARVTSSRVASFTNLLRLPFERAARGDAARERTALEAMHANLARDVSRCRRTAARRARTFPHRLRDLAVDLFAVYCVFRLAAAAAFAAAAAVAAVWPRAGTPPTDPESHDVLATTIARMLPVSANEETVALLLSFLISSSLFVCSLSNVAATLDKLVRLVPRSLRAAPEASRGPARAAHAALLRALPLLMAQLVGIYTISTIFMLKTSIPSDFFRNLLVDGAADSTVEYLETLNKMTAAQIVAIFDRWFMVGCVAGAVSLGAEAWRGAGGGWGEDRAARYLERGRDMLLKGV